MDKRKIEEYIISSGIAKEDFYLSVSDGNITTDRFFVNAYNRNNKCKYIIKYIESANCFIVWNAKQNGSILYLSRKKFYECIEKNKEYTSKGVGYSTIATQRVYVIKYDKMAESINNISF